MPCSVAASAVGAGAGASAATWPAAAAAANAPHECQRGKTEETYSKPHDRRKEGRAFTNSKLNAGGTKERRDSKNCPAFEKASLSHSCLILQVPVLWRLHQAAIGTIPTGQTFARAATMCRLHLWPSPVWPKQKFRRMSGEVEGHVNCGGVF